MANHFGRSASNRAVESSGVVNCSVWTLDILPTKAPFGMSTHEATRDICLAYVAIALRNRFPSLGAELLRVGQVVLE
jgi:hypothetical protein